MTTILNDTDQWDDRQLGASAEHVRVAPESDEDFLDSALGMQLISIRLQKQLIRDLKEIAVCQGVGYQPLIRDLLIRFVQSERQGMLTQQLNDLQKQEQESAKHSSVAVNQFIERLR
jgi:hypothetical protein